MKTLLSASIFLVLVAGIGIVYTIKDAKASALDWPLSVPVKDLPAPSNLHPTLAQAGGLLGGVTCGEDSSLYYRRLPATGSALETPITRLDSDGVESSLNLHSVPSTAGHVYVMAFGVDSQGGLYSILRAEKDGSEYLASYDHEGALRWSSPLSISIRPSLLLPVRGSSFLVSGMSEPRSHAVTASFVGLLDKSGKVMRSLTDKSDDSATVRTASGSLYNPALELSSAKTGQDGSVYLFKAAAYPKVQVLDGQGSTLRALQLMPPGDNSQATDFFLDGQSIGVLYQQQLPPENGRPKGRLLLALYSAADGSPTKLYIQKAPGILACMSGGQATILSTTVDHHFAIGHIPLN